MKQGTTVVSASLPIFIADIIDLTKKGWEVHPDYEPNQGPILYECLMVREPTPEQTAEDNKPSRAEILAKARAAKAAKADA
jgi:hypothetical protein